MLDKKIAYNSIISLCARAIGLAISLVTLGLITRYLSQAGYGAYATVLAFLYFFTVLSDLGLYSICLREISRPKADEVKIASNAFTLRFFAGLLIFAAAPLIVYFFPYPAQVKWGVLVGAFGCWLMSSHQVLMGIFQKYLRMDKVALGELAGRLIHVGLVYLFIGWKLDFLFIIGAFAGGALVNFLIVVLLSRKYIPISFEFDFVFWRDLLKQSLPLALAVIFTVIYFKLDTLMLSLMKPSEDVGIYNLAYKFLESLLFFPAMFVGLTMPLMSKYALNIKDKFRTVLQQSLDVLLVIAVPLIVGTSFVSLKLVFLIVGFNENYAPSAIVLNILIVAAGLIFLGILFSNALIALNRQKSLIWVFGTGAVVNLVANFFFISKFSYCGAAITTVFTELIVLTLLLIILYDAAGQLPLFSNIWKYILSGGAMAVFLYFSSDLPFFAVLSVSAIIYFGCLSLIGGFSIKSVVELIKIKT